MVFVSGPDSGDPDKSKGPSPSTTTLGSNVNPTASNLSGLVADGEGSVPAVDRQKLNKKEDKTTGPQKRSLMWVDRLATILPTDGKAGR